MLNDYRLHQIENYAKFKLIMIDTCSWMNYRVDQFLEIINPLLIANRHQFIVHHCVRNELSWLAADQRNPERQAVASQALQRIEQLDQQKLVQWIGDLDCRTIPDAIFLTLFSQLRLQNQLLLITQDQQLARDVLRLNQVQSAKGYPVMVKRITGYGGLDNFLFPAESGQLSPAALPQRAAGTPQSAVAGLASAGSRSVQPGSPVLSGSSRSIGSFFKRLACLFAAF